MTYVLTCLRCGFRITSTARVGNAEVAAVEGHLRADHPEVLPAGRRPDFAEVFGTVRVKMGE